jgi:hypothetical protein
MAAVLRNLARAQAACEMDRGAWQELLVTADGVTSIEWIGPFGKPFRSHAVTKSSIDFSRLIVVLLAVNFLPAVLLWRHDEIAGWLERNKRDSATIPRTILVERARGAGSLEAYRLASLLSPFSLRALESTLALFFPRQSQRAPV